MLDQLNRINLLYDIYASLLTGRQRETLHLYFSENYSLAEIAAEYDTSRQAVYDLIRRALLSMDKFEEKLGLYRLFNEQQELLAEADSLLLNDNIKDSDLRRLKEIISDLRSSSEK